MSAYSTRYMPLAVLSVAALLVAGSLGLRAFGNEWRWINGPVHSAVETLGALAALSMGFLLLSSHGRRAWNSTGVALGFIALAIGDGLHAMVDPGQAFVFLKSLASLAGGIGFALVWFSALNNPPRYKAAAVVGVIVLMAGLGVWALAAEATLPAMIENGRFTPLAVAMNALAGVCFLAAALRFAMFCKQKAGTEMAAYALSAALFGLGSLFFPESMLWDATWWFWHVLRLAAYLIVFWLVIKTYNQAIQSKVDSEQMLRTILDTVEAHIYLKDVTGRYLFANRIVRELMQTRLDDIVGFTDARFFDEETASRIREDDRRVLELGESIRKEETNTVGHSGQSATYLTVKMPLMHQNGEIYALCGISTDITDRKRAEEKISYMAFHDALTGLPNRSLFLDRLGQALTGARRASRCGAVLFVDLDQFKSINDIYGHDVGDAVLRSVAHKLSQFLRQDDTVARLGGDEFVILLPELSAEEYLAAEYAVSVGEKVLAALEEPAQIDGQAFRVTASIGVSVFPKQNESPEDLIREADIAMYRAKQSGRNALVSYQDEMHATLSERYRLEQDLHVALRKGELELHLQSQVDTRGKVMGAEALVRWRHPKRGLMMPASFIPLAEETGLIVPIGEWVLQEACRLLGSLRAGGRCLRLAVNVSSRQFHQPDFADRLREIVESSGADPACLTLELTESLLVDRAADVVARMHALAAFGVRFSIDDFGTGYSSLAYLKRLPLNELKIDRSFVQDLPQDASVGTLVNTILAMAHSLGFQVVAEGVETSAQWDFLTLGGCDYYQGFHFHRPEPATEWLARMHQ